MVLLGDRRGVVEDVVCIDVDERRMIQVKKM